MALKTKYSPLQHFSLENIYTAFGGLSPRNKIVALAVVGLVVILIIFLPLSLFSGKVSSLQKEIRSSQKGFDQVADKIAEYQRVQADIAALEQAFAGASGSLTSRVEGLARQAGLTVDQLREKAPQETDFFEVNSVEVKLSGVSLQQLVDFLLTLENEKTAPMRVRRIDIKPKNNNRQVLDVTCEVATFALKKET